MRAVVGKKERLDTRVRRLQGCEDIFLEEALVDEFFQVLSDASAIDGLMPLTVMVGAVFSRSEM